MGLLSARLNRLLMLGKGAEGSRLGAIWAEVVMLVIVSWWGLRRAKQQVRFVQPSEPHALLKKGLAKIQLEEFYVPNILRNSWAQFGCLFLNWRLQKIIEPTRREALRLKHSGGDEVVLDWYYPEKLKCEKPPIMVYVAGITGTTKEAIPFVKKVLERGWIAVVFHRRGHVTNLSRACFNIFGSALDLRTAIYSIEHSEPQLPIAIVGSSAGSAVLVRYLGEYAHDPRVVAGIGISPGYSINEVWLEITGTFFDRYILSGLKKFFVERNRSILEKRNFEGVKRLESAQSVHEFARHAAAFSSEHHEDVETEVHTFEDWLNQTCPLVFSDNIATPIICINALDDPVCTKKLVLDVGCRIPDKNRYSAMILSDYGSHCAHQSLHNWLPENWSHKVALDFVEGVLE